MKCCTKCGTERPYSDFHKRSDGQGRRSQCIPCVKATRQKACESCGRAFLPEGRHASRCVDCYPYYRQAVNLHAASTHRAAKNGLAFDLTIDWIEERLRQPCPRTGVEFQLLASSKDYGDRGPYGPSLDKINPSLGYTKDNVEVVCWWYNVTKQRFSNEEVLELCKMVVRTASSYTRQAATTVEALTPTQSTPMDTPIVSHAMPMSEATVRKA